MKISMHDSAFICARDLQSRFEFVLSKFTYIYPLEYIVIEKEDINSSVQRYIHFCAEFNIDICTGSIFSNAASCNATICWS